SGISGTLSAEWFNPATLATTTVNTPVSGGGNTTFTAPFSGPSVLYLTQVTAPTVTLSGIAAGSTVKGNVTLGASVVNGSTVASVNFMANGSVIATTTSPYNTSWDTTTISDGTYQLTAVARDSGGNVLATS